MRVIPFDVIVPPERRDTHLVEKLTSKEELSAAIAWCVLGWIDYQKLGGVAAPDSVMLASQEYLDSYDSVRAFLSDHCWREPGQTIGCRDLHRLYLTWCTLGKRAPEKERRFISLVERDYRKIDRSSGRVFEDIFYSPTRANPDTSQQFS